MITDARALAPGSMLSAEVCVIGGGPVGITTAMELDRLGRTVLLLESGDLYVEEADSEALNEGECVGYQPQGMFGGRFPIQDFSQRSLGGASNHFAGFCHPFEDTDLAGWPITKAEFDSWLPTAHNFWGLGPVNYDPVYWSGVTGQPVPPKLGIELDFKMVQQRPQQFGPTYLSQMAASTNINLMHHANATNLNAAAGGATVQTVTVQTLSGIQFQVQANVFVVAVGGIQTPRLLLMSNDVVPQGIGNQNDQVGRYYADHLGSGLAFMYLRNTMAELGLMTPIDNVATATPSGAATTVNLKPVIDMSSAASASLGCSLHFEIGMYDVSNYPKQDSGITPRHLVEYLTAKVGAPQSMAIFRTFLKPTSNPNSRVTLGSLTDPFGRPRPRLDWQPLAIDSANRKAAMKFIGGQLDMGGLSVLHDTLGWVLPDGPNPGNVPGWLKITPAGDEPNPFHESCYHNMCTTRMSATEADGVVDSNLRVHTTNNLYCAGPSVFHTGAGYYPTMPSVALAARLATHLNGVLP